MEMFEQVADVLGWMAMGFATVIAAEALRKLVDLVRNEEIEGLRRRLVDVEALRRDPAHLSEALQIVAHLNELRADEGDSVEILCDDPEAWRLDERVAIICQGHWTDFQPRRFYGSSVLQCLAMATAARRSPGGIIAAHLRDDDLRGSTPAIRRPVHGGYPG